MNQFSIQMIIGGNSVSCLGFGEAGFDMSFDEALITFTYRDIQKPGFVKDLLFQQAPGMFVQ